MSTMRTTAAILFEPEAYVLDGPKLMGRQAAGNAFLRAAVAGRGADPVVCVTPHRESAEVFARLVKSFDPAAEAKWAPSGHPDALKGVGTLYVPGPVLEDEAFLRLRQAPDAYSIVGVTHTTASKAAMEAIASLVRAPVMPWDALICTSSAVLQTVNTVIEAETGYLRWRLGRDVDVALPQLPVIPLGVHCDDFVMAPGKRIEARTALKIADDEIVALFVGRLSFHAKAHPHAMYVALEATAKRTGKKIVLIQCGWFANKAIDEAFTSGARQFCPSVRALFTDGKDAAVRQRSWAAADIFISLSDNIQETFGLAPIEGMAAGLPVVVTDWDGYKDTVRDGIDGFRVPVAAPAGGSGAAIARGFEAGQFNYDQYCAVTSRTVSVDTAVLTDQLCELAVNSGLRQRLGAAGQVRARTQFDWSVIYQRYRDLYAGLEKIRTRAGVSAIGRKPPTASPAHLDPTVAFGHYPTHPISQHTRVALAGPADLAAFKSLASHALFGFLPETLPPQMVLERIFAALALQPLIVEDIAREVACTPADAVYSVAVLAKMGLVTVAA